MATIFPSKLSHPKRDSEHVSYKAVFRLKWLHGFVLGDPSLAWPLWGSTGATSPSTEVLVPPVRGTRRDGSVVAHGGEGNEGAARTGTGRNELRFFWFFFFWVRGGN